MNKRINAVLILFMALFFVNSVIFAETRSSCDKKQEKTRKTILFVPIDSRPVTSEQTIKTIALLGYKVLTPPKYYLGTKTYSGNPDGFWNWLYKTTEENQKDIMAVVLSCDSMVYGSLVASRVHDYSNEVIMERVQNFAEYHKRFPKIKVYGYSSIMRTMRWTKSGVEPKIYEKYGDKIFRYTVLLDKRELGLASYKEKLELLKLGVTIPKDYLNDWMEHRDKNFVANKAMMGLAKNGAFTYLAFGRDDNSEFCQTHRESRKLSEYVKEIQLENFQNIAGLDEFGLLLAMRAINEATGEKPTIYVEFNIGVGGNTIPMFSDEPISKTIKDHIQCVGGTEVESPVGADLVLLVNTPEDGKSIEHYQITKKGMQKPEAEKKPELRKNQIKSAEAFVRTVENSLRAGYPTAVGDISHPNGSDDAVMKELRVRNLLFKLRSYAGWNTATNSTGFALCQGLIANKLSVYGRVYLLLVRYIDDWLYQRLVRTVVMKDLEKVGQKYIFDFADKKQVIEQDINELMQAALDICLPPFEFLEDINFFNPWERMFEVGIRFNRFNN